MLHRWAFCLLEFLLACATAGSLHAQQPIHETVVVTGTATPEALANVGRTLAVVTADELAQLPITSAVEALRLVSSVDVRTRGARGVQADFALRGAGFGQALVLVDGVPVNDTQTGHHNGDLPVALDDVERIEVLLGSGSSLHGADALGGAINVVTRRDARRGLARLVVGQHDLVEAAATIGLGEPIGAAHALSGEWRRASGFMPARDHDVRLARYAGTFRRSTSVSLGYVDKAFGANGFYGPAPSREWTDQLLGTGSHRFGVAAWQAAVQGSYRTHGDRFVYDERRPTLSQNDHRTHAVTGSARAHRLLTAAAEWTVGAAAGHDTIDSTNLGARDVTRAGAFTEVRWTLGDRVLLHPGLRVDTYDPYGTSWSPAVAASGWVRPAIRWRSALGRAFRVPTFTERFYTDPNHRASGDLSPETAWSADAGLDAFSGTWSASATVFSRREDHVIDWVRESAAVPWRTTNVREVRTRGLEGAFRRAGTGGAFSAQYTWVASEAPALRLLSKYVADYARHRLAASASARWRAFTIGSRVEFARRSDARESWVTDLRVGRRVGRVEVHAAATNLFDRRYQEIVGVEMPGRWVTLGVTVR